jgi:hypothetical protein
MDDTQIRLLDEHDSLGELTALLHRAYGELGAMGFRYKAVDQNVSLTRTRIANGECYVAIRDQEIVGTAVLLPPRGSLATATGMPAQTLPCSVSSRSSLASSVAVWVARSLAVLKREPQSLARRSSASAPQKQRRT